jgi:hypothetical protein
MIVLTGERRTRIGKQVVFFLVVCLSLAVAGCQTRGKAAPAQPTPTQTPVKTSNQDRPLATAARFELRPSSTPVPIATLFSPIQLKGSGIGPDIFPDGVNPLTGLILSDPTRLERRPMVIKIANFPRSSRPQWGLNAADHVYEYYLEDELTRFIGVFYGNDAIRVGPIRSARPFDEYIVRAYKGIFAFGYADDRVINLWEDDDLSPFLVIEHPDNCPPMCRIGPKTEYNTLFTDTALLSQYVSDKGISNGRQPLEGLYFEDKSFLTNGGGAANHIQIRFSPMSYHYWEYDSGSKRYQRWQDTERAPAGAETYAPLVDALDNQPVAADNLVILYAPVDFFYLSRSTEIYNIMLKGSGEGYAVREGHIFAIHWERKKSPDMITLSFPNGMPYPLKPGNTWFEVLNTGGPHQVDGATWRFEFVPPPIPDFTQQK